MVTYAHAPSGLVKATWGGNDYSAMRWDGSTVRAVHIGKYEDNRVQFLEDGTVDTEFDDLDDTVAWDFLLLDIDYVVSRPEPEMPGREAPGPEPTYWVAPATVSFSLASNISVKISDGSSPPVSLALGTTETATTLVISDVQRIGSDARFDPQWRVTGEGFDISVSGATFWLYIRAAPQQVARPLLEMAERGGVSFVERAFA